jgi:hypothetical protein
MSLHTAGPDAHLADDELLRFIDGEDDPLQPEWAEHVTSCARCSHDVQLLRGHAGVVREWLDRAAFEDALPPRLHVGEADSARRDSTAARRASTAPRPDSTAAPRRDSAAPRRDSTAPRRDSTAPRRDSTAPRRARQSVAPWLRAAAVLVLLASPLAAIPALRQWLVGTVTELRDTTGMVPAAMPQERSAAPGSSAIRFVPVAGTFAVDLDVAQATGVLVIRHGTGHEAVLQQTGTDEVEPVISAASLRVRNESGSTASFHLQLPVTVSRVVVRVAGAYIRTVDAAALAAGVSIDLAR